MYHFTDGGRGVSDQVWKLESLTYEEGVKDLTGEGLEMSQLTG